MLVKILEDSNQAVSKELETLAGQDSQFNKKRSMVIGLGKFKMEIDIAAETKKLRELTRKVGDKSGVGCPTAQPASNA